MTKNSDRLTPAEEGEYAARQDFYRAVEEEEKPKLKLSGEDGNAFMILGRAIDTARKSGWSEQEIEDFRVKAMDGDYGHLLKTCTEHFDVE